MASIFVSYRREDSAGHAGRLFDQLKEHFGQQSVFWDVSGSIEPGEPFDGAIERAVASCDALLAIIGPTWVTSADAQGKRRIDDPDDFVRMEISKALRRNVRVVPVLVHRATMPSAKELPEDLQPLARHQAIELSDSRWDYDVSQLIRSLDRKTGRQVPRRRLGRPIAVAAVVVLLIAGGVGLWVSQQKRDTTSDAPPPAVGSRLPVDRPPSASSPTGMDLGAFQEVCVDVSSCFSLRFTDECDVACAEETAEILRDTFGIPVGVDTDHSPLGPAGCIGYRSDFGGTAEMAELVREVLGHGYYVGDCTDDGAAINVRARELFASREDVRAFLEACADGSFCFSLRFNDECDVDCAEETAEILRDNFGIPVSVDTDHGPLGPAGCIGYRSDIGGTAEMAELVREVLGDGFYVGDCNSAGFAVNVHASSISGAS